MNFHTNTNTLTASQTDAYTEARAKYVMGKAYDDFLSMLSRGFRGITKNKLDDWRDVILYLMDKKALTWFQLQFTFADGKSKAVMYELQANGMFLSDDNSGGINFFQFPSDTSVTLVIQRNQNNRSATDAYMTAHGWVGGAKEITGPSSAGVTYSKDNYGLTRKIIG